MRKRHQGDRRVTGGSWRFALPLGMALLGMPPPASAQATAPVPPEDRTYRLLDRLAGQLAPAGLIHGQRPYSRGELARLTLELGTLLDSLEAGPRPPSTPRLRYLRETLAALRSRYAAELARLAPEDSAGPDPPRGTGRLQATMDAVRAEASLAHSPFRGFAWNGLGYADNAEVNPLLDYRQGRELADGVTAAIEGDARMRLASHWVVFGGARLAFHAARDGEPEPAGGLTLRTMAARGQLGGWALQVGRVPVRRGQGRHAGLLLSANAPPLDMLHLENEKLFRLPWLLGRLGPGRFSAFFADLGADHNFPHAKLYGNWLAFRPSNRLELGGGFIVQDGGEGAPEQSFWRRVADYLLFVDVLFQGSSDFEASNKIAGLDFRLWLPETGAVVYGEVYLDDFDVRRVGEILWLDASHILGVELPRLDGVGQLSGWAEYHHTGIRMYRHYDFSSGVTRGRFLLGSGLGSDAHAFIAGLDHAPSPAGTLSLEAAWEWRGHDEWSASVEPSFHFRRVEGRPKERRARIQLTWDRRPPGAGAGWRLEVGAERVANFGFIEGAGSTNGALRLVVDWAPGGRGGP